MDKAYNVGIVVMGNQRANNGAALNCNDTHLLCSQTVRIGKTSWFGIQARWVGRGQRQSEATRKGTYCQCKR